MIKGFKEKRVQAEKDLESKSSSNLKTVEQRMKIDIQKYDENRIENVTITFPNEGSIT